MYSLDDTIAAISTPIGEGGIGIVRLTGPEARAILDRIFALGADPSQTELEPRVLHYGHIIDPASRQAIDEVLAVHMPAPKTYTRQDIVEIQGHGGIVALRGILSLCLRQGARLAEPGEFTARAFLNGRLDLAQAEAVLDVVQARTEVSLQAAIGQLAGSLSDQVRAVRASLMEALVYLEASLDFAEDEIPERGIGADMEQAVAHLSCLLEEAERGIIYRQGIRAAIVGRPNVGKSSLLNRLLRTSRAIVTSIPGTTRDTLEETVNLQGIPVVLVDTAGITDKSEDVIERLGIERSRAALSQSDLALLVLDASQPPTEADRAIASIMDGKPSVVVLNKIDLTDAVHRDVASILNAPAVHVSALTGTGIQDLEQTIVDTVFSGQVAAAEPPAVTSPRHKEALARALDHAQVALSAHREGLLADLVAIDLTAAVNALGEITGQTAGEDLVELIFSRFCVGK
ncbi:MAG: tRNA uridine-5-carboxymethylaminomethyl(34) synthesis GTPase MnmE [Anaerolineae bacterium]|jgi:tRNA modification GTPase